MPAASDCNAGYCDVMIMGFQTQSASPFAVASLAASLSGCCAQSSQSDRHGLYTNKVFKVGSIYGLVVP